MITLEIRRELLESGRARKQRYDVNRYQSSLSVKADPNSHTFKFECQLVKWAERLMKKHREAVDGVGNYELIAKGSPYYCGNNYIQIDLLEAVLFGPVYKSACHLVALEFDDSAMRCGASMLGVHLSSLAFMIYAKAPKLVKLPEDLIGKPIPPGLNYSAAGPARILRLRAG